MYQSLQMKEQIQGYLLKITVLKKWIRKIKVLAKWKIKTE